MPVTLVNDTISGVGVGGYPSGIFTPANFAASSFINFEEISTPVIKEWSGTGDNTNLTVSLTGLPNPTNYILADVFITCNANDHANFTLGDSTTPTGYYTSWTDNSRGIQPTSYMSSITQQVNSYTNPGQSDGFTPNYGTWWGSQIIKVVNNTSLRCNVSGSSAGTVWWVYLRIRATSK
jgi:hypothetical protein